MPVDYIGPVPLGNAALLSCKTYDSSGQPTGMASGNEPTYTIYNSTYSDPMQNGTGTGSLLTTAITGLYKATKTLLSSDGYAVNKAHAVVWQWTTGSTTYAYEQRLIVV